VSLTIAWQSLEGECPHGVLIVDDAARLLVEQVRLSRRFHMSHERLHRALSHLFKKRRGESRPHRDIVAPVLPDEANRRIFLWTNVSLFGVYECIRLAAEYPLQKGHVT
jgi:hypothetical protein